jgi:alpha-1,6-mannosyltransferase
MPALATKGSVDITTKRQRLMIYLLVLAGVIFRSELALLLASQLFYLLVMPSISLGTIIPTGVCSATIALAISVPIDSYFWQRPIWPELAGFVYNVIQGKSADWGTSPIHAYFGNFLPKILLNPVILLFLIPYAVFHSNPAMRRPARGLVIPSLLFISIYSLQPHKEARFIIYTVPPLTACAAVAANYIFSRRSRTLIYAILSLGIMASIVLSFGASTLMLAISSLNYPGGEALYRLHQIAAEDKPGARTVNVHMDVLSCMTGVSRFEQDFPTPPFIAQLLSSLQPRDSDYTQTVPLSTRLKFRYDKTENATALLDPSFWTQFDYVLAEEPERVIGSWEIVDTIYGYAGIEVLRPGMASASGVDNKHYAAKVWDEMAEIGGAEESMQEQRHRQIAQGMELSARLREGVREKITRGWWIGPKLEAKIRVLRRVP